MAFNKADLIQATARNGENPGPAVAGRVLISAVELLARVRERGTVELIYRSTDVRVTGRVSPPLAAELEAVAARWRESRGQDAPQTGAD